jgi:hypothetical protein
VKLSRAQKWLLGGAVLYAALRPRRVGLTDPIGPERPRTDAPARSRCAWVRRKLELLAPLGVTGRPAVLLVAHWRRETGGREHNWNVGNVRAFHATTAPWFRGASGLPWRAYDSEADGVRGGLDVIRHGARYEEAWSRLLRGDVGWYRELIAAGYAEGESPEAAQADYEEILRAVEACV